MASDLCDEDLTLMPVARHERGEVAIDAPVMYFYNPALVTSDFHESQIFVIEEGGHRFFAERSTR